MVNLLKIRRARSLHSLAQVGPITGAIEAMEKVLSLVEKARSFHSCKTLATDVGKADITKTQDCKALDAVCRGCGKKGHFEKVCLKAKCSTHSLEVPQASTSSTGASEPLYFDDQGQPVFAHMVSVLHSNKHLIKFPIFLDYGTLQSRGSREGWNKMENSTDSTVCSKCSTVLLKADTGADVNLMNRHLINSLVRLRPKTFYNQLLLGWKIMEIQQ